MFEFNIKYVFELKKKKEDGMAWFNAFIGICFGSGFIPAVAYQINTTS